jgi:hypothetical protein
VRVTRIITWLSPWSRTGTICSSWRTKASLRLAKTVPASLNGAAGALRYVREHYDVGRYPMYEVDGYRLLLFSTERAICAAAGIVVPHCGR